MNAHLHEREFALQFHYLPLQSNHFLSTLTTAQCVGWQGHLLAIAGLSRLEYLLTQGVLGMVHKLGRKRGQGNLQG